MSGVEESEHAVVVVDLKKTQQREGSTQVSAQLEPVNSTRPQKVLTEINGDRKTPDVILHPSPITAQPIICAFGY
jgi:hypothetical protein